MSEVNHAKPELNESKVELVRRVGNSSKPRRKRDSSTLFDISLDDLTEPDHSGFLTEKHSGKDWWCVLQDQHLCMFPSQNSQELAYDVLLIPCCEISLDDVYTESPVFRLTQVGSTPWVFSAGIERNLRAWIRALYRACGKDDSDWNMRSSKKCRGRKLKHEKRNMKVLTSTIDESEEREVESLQVNGTAAVDENESLENESVDKEAEAIENVNDGNSKEIVKENIYDRKNSMIFGKGKLMEGDVAKNDLGKHIQNENAREELKICKSKETPEVADNEDASGTIDANKTPDNCNEEQGVHDDLTVNKQFKECQNEECNEVKNQRKSDDHEKEVNKSCDEEKNTEVKRFFTRLLLKVLNCVESASLIFN